MPTVTVDDRIIAYDDTGSGDPIVWLQGTGESRQAWVGHTTTFSQRYRCIATDHRDVGESSYFEQAYTPKDLALDAAAVMDALGTGPAHVVGYSLGGAAAQELALARPDLVRSLVLMATWAKTDGWFEAQMRNWQAVRRAFWDDERAFLEGLGAWWWSPATYATPGMVDGLNTFMESEEPRQRPEGWIRQCDADIAHDAASRLGSVTVPALVIVGEDDVCTPARYARELCALLPAAELLTVADAGHGAFAEKATDVIAAMAEFFGRV
ncbi:MAG: alpha/beta hydrolase [Actinomycetota bacterium]